MEDPVVKELERSMLPKVFDDTESSSEAEILVRFFDYLYYFVCMIARRLTDLYRSFGW